MNFDMKHNIDLWINIDQPPQSPLTNSESPAWKCQVADSRGVASGFDKISQEVRLRSVATLNEHIVAFSRIIRYHGHDDPCVFSNALTACCYNFHLALGNWGWWEQHVWVNGDAPRYDDAMPSYFIAETLKSRFFATLAVASELADSLGWSRQCLSFSFSMSPSSDH